MSSQANNNLQQSSINWNMNRINSKNQLSLYTPANTSILGSSPASLLYSKQKQEKQEDCRNSHPVSGSRKQSQSLHKNQSTLRQPNFTNSIQVAILPPTNSPSPAPTPSPKHMVLPLIPMISKMDSLGKLQEYLHSVYMRQKEQRYQKRVHEREAAEIKRMERIKQLHQLQQKKKAQRQYEITMQKKLDNLKAQLTLQSRVNELQKIHKQQYWNQYQALFGHGHGHDRFRMMPSLSSSFIRSHQKQSKPQPPTKSKSKSLLRKFRIIGYVVFFSLFFPKYAAKFTKLRFQYKQEHNLKKPKHIKQAVTQFHKILNRLPVLQHLRQLQKAAKKKQRTFGTEDAFIQFNGQFDQNTQSELGYHFRVSNIEDILIFILKKVRDMIIFGQIQPFIKIMSQILMIGSFPADHFYLIEEIAHINFHKTKNYLKMNTQTQKLLIFSTFFYKMIIFGYLLNAQHSQQVIMSITKGKLIMQQLSDEIDLLLKYLTLSGFYLQCLFTRTMKITLKNSIKTQQLPSLTCLPLPITMLKFMSREESLQMQTQTTQTQMISAFNILQNDTFQTDYQGVDIGKLPFVHNLEQFEGLIDQVFQVSQKEGQIIDLIEDIKEKIYQQCKKQKRMLYHSIRDRVLKEKRIIGKNQLLESKFFQLKRDSQDWQHLQICLNILQNAKRHRNGTLQSITNKIITRTSQERASSILSVPLSQQSKILVNSQIIKKQVQNKRRSKQQNKKKKPPIKEVEDENESLISETVVIKNRRR